MGQKGYSRKYYRKKLNTLIGQGKLLLNSLCIEDDPEKQKELRLTDGKAEELPIFKEGYQKW